MGRRISSPVFIGRWSELATLDAAVSQAADGHARMVLVGGEAGIGKSRLVGEAAARASGRGCLVLAGGGVALADEATLPYGALVEILRSMVRQLSPDALAAAVGAGSELGRLLPELGRPDTPDPAPGMRPEWRQMRIFEELLGCLSQLAERQPVVLVVEDLQWADRATRDALAFLIRAAGATRLAILGTYRSDGAELDDRLRSWLANLSRLPAVERVGLEVMGDDGIEAVLAAIADDPAHPPDGRIAAIVRRAEGNPFFAEELVAMSGHDDAIPEGLREVLIARLRTLSGPAQDVVRLAAVAGRSVDHDLLVAVAGAAEEELEPALAEADAASVLLATNEDGRPTYTFRHALVRDVAYDDLLPSIRRRWHAAFHRELVVRAVPPGAAAAGHWAAIADHAIASGSEREGVVAWLAAARAAAASFAFTDAAAAYDRVLELRTRIASPDRPADPDDADFFAESARAHAYAGDLATGVQLARRAVAAVDPTVGPMRAAELHELQGRVAWLAGDLVAATAALDAGRGLLVGQPPSTTSARIAAGRAGLEMLRGHHTQAIDLAREAIDLAREVGSRDAESHALTTLGSSLAELGDCAQALRASREGLDVALAVGSVADISRGMTNLGACHADCGDREASLAQGLAAAAWARENGVWRVFGAFDEVNVATDLRGLGRWREAETILERVVAADVAGMAGVDALRELGSLRVRQGRRDEARQLLERAIDDGASMRQSQHLDGATFAMIELLLDEGDLVGARAAVDAARADIDAQDAVRTRVALRESALRVAAERIAVARTRRDAVTVDAILDEAASDVAAVRAIRNALADVDRPIAAETRHLATCAEAEWARVEGRPDPGVCEAAARPYPGIDPYWSAYYTFRRAEAELAVGRPRRDVAVTLADARAIADGSGAFALVERIDALARRARLDLARRSAGGADPAPQGSRAVADPFGLTPREREVLALIAEGYTNRRIAEALFISESTASVHVSNIIGKLGVTNRLEAATIAVRAGLDAPPRGG